MTGSPMRLLPVMPLVVFWATTQVVAGNMSWSFQQIDANPQVSPTPVAIAMGPGASWPKVCYEKSYDGGANKYVAAAYLKPTGWSTALLGKVQGSTYMSARCGPDGRVGVTWKNGTAFEFAQSAGQGWQHSTVVLDSLSTSPYRSSLAYTLDNRPVVAYTDKVGKLRVAGYDGRTWDDDTVMVGGVSEAGRYSSVAVDSQNRLAAVYSKGTSTVYAVRDTATSAWSAVSVPSTPAGNHYSLAFAPNDQPAFAVLHSGALDFAAFNIVSGKWQVSTIASGLATSARVNLVFNRQGHAGLAFVRDSELCYMVNDGSGWLTHVLPATGDLAPNAESDAALAFDNDDLPVIAYHSTNAGLMLAYDPIVAPEPASLLLLGLGLGLVHRRRKRG